MSNEINTLPNTNDVDEINKNKILVSKTYYQESRAACLSWCFPLGGLTYLCSLFILPYAMKSIPFIPISLELRVLTGLLSGVPLSYLAVKRSKQRCEKRVENTYYYNN